jgi:hypothetical protein
MAIKLVVQDINTVDETMRPLYVERDGAFHLDAEGFEDHPTVSKYKQQQEAARRSERAMKTQIDKWEKLGKTDEEIQALIAAEEHNKQTALERAGEWDKLKEQMNNKHKEEIKKWEGLTEAEKQNNVKLRGRLERYLVDAKATAAIAAAEGEPELLLPIVKRFMKVTEDLDTGEFSTSIVDDKGGARVNGKGDPLTVDELLLEMKSSEKLGRAFKASGASGGGSSPGGGSNPKTTPAGVPKTWAEAKTAEDKAKFIAHQKTLKATA